MVDEDASLPPSPPASDIEDEETARESQQDEADLAPVQKQAGSVRSYRDVGVQTLSLPPSPPDDDPIIISESRPSTPSSRTVTPKPGYLHPKGLSYNALSLGRPARRIFSAPDRSLESQAFGDFTEASLASVDESLSLPDDTDVDDPLEDLNAFSRLSFGLRSVSLPSPDAPVFETHFPQPRSVSDNLAALEHAAAARNELRSYDMTNMDEFDTTPSGFMHYDATFETHVSHDWPESSVPVPTRYASSRVLMHGRHDQLYSPPRPIPALHGPLSLPYARCPSGAEGTVIEGPNNLQHIVWGLDKSVQAPPTPDCDDQRPIKLTEAGDGLSPNPPQRARQASGSSIGNLLERRAADLGPRRRTNSASTASPEWSATPAAVDLNAYLLAARASAGHYSVNLMTTIGDPLPQELYEARQRLDSQIALLQLQQYHQYQTLLLPQMQSLANQYLDATSSGLFLDPFTPHGQFAQYALASFNAEAEYASGTAFDWQCLPPGPPQMPVKRPRALERSGAMPQAYNLLPMGEGGRATTRHFRTDSRSVPDIVTTPATPITHTRVSSSPYDPNLLQPMKTALSYANDASQLQWSTTPSTHASASSTSSSSLSWSPSHRAIPMARLLQHQRNSGPTPASLTATQTGSSNSSSTTLGSPVQLHARVNLSPPKSARPPVTAIAPVPAPALPGWLKIPRPPPPVGIQSAWKRQADVEDTGTSDTRREWVYPYRPIEALTRECGSDEEVVLFGQNGGATTLTNKSRSRSANSLP